MVRQLNWWLYKICLRWLEEWSSHVLVGFIREHIRLHSRLSFLAHGVHVPSPPKQMEFLCGVWKSMGFLAMPQVPSAAVYMWIMLFVDCRMILAVTGFLWLYVVFDEQGGLYRIYSNCNGLQLWLLELSSGHNVNELINQTGNVWVSPYILVVLYRRITWTIQNIGVHTTFWYRGHVAPVSSCHSNTLFGLYKSQRCCFPSSTPNINTKHVASPWGTKADDADSTLCWT